MNVKSEKTNTHTQVVHLTPISDEYQRNEEEEKAIIKAINLGRPFTINGKEFRIEADRYAKGCMYCPTCNNCTLELMSWCAYAEQVYENKTFVVDNQLP